MATKRLLPLLARPSLYTSTLLAPLHHHPPCLTIHLPTHKPALHFHHTVPSIRHYSSTSQPPKPKSYTFEEIQSITSSPKPSKSSPSQTLIIDVREPAELASTGCIPGAVHMPIKSNPDAVYLSREDFEDRFGFVKPGSVSLGMGGEEGEGEEEENTPATAGHGGADASADLGVGGYAGGGGGGGSDGGAGEGEGEAVKEVVFYCKAGVRSRFAAQMAAGDGGWKGVRVGEMGGGMDEWVGRGGGVER